MTHDFLLVIPAYRESTRLPPYLSQLALAIERQGLAARILIVDDGSGSVEKEALLRALDPIRQSYASVLEPMCLDQNIGKGGAIMRGWSIPSTARWLAFVDADGAIPTAEVVRLFKAVLSNNDPRRCYFASRVRMLGRVVDRNLGRHLSGRIFASLVGLLIHPGIYDSQCGFKIIPQQAFRAVQSLIVEKRFAFDVELLAALVDTGFPLEEVPIDWHDVAGSKVSFFRDTVRMVRQVWRIRSSCRCWSRNQISIRDGSSVIALRSDTPARPRRASAS